MRQYRNDEMKRRWSILFIAIGSYAAAMIFSFVLNVFLLYKIEQSGVKRWGATGRLFKYKED